MAISNFRFLAEVANKPEKASELSEKLTRKQLLRSLPRAIKLVKKENRDSVSAALELSIHSSFKLFPLFLSFAEFTQRSFKKKKGFRLNDFYKVFEIKKKSGGKRVIAAPAISLKTLQTALLRLLGEEEVSFVSTGFRKGKSIKDNAIPHVNKKIVVNIDIKEFFSSTTFNQIVNLTKKFKTFNLSENAANLFSEICCYKGTLPTGAPTSPILSNLILKEFDFIILSFCKKNKITYTRYADDLTFSGNDNSVLSIIRFSETILNNFGYDLEKKKTNIFRKGRRQVVTGIVVNKKINIARATRRKLRAAIHGFQTINSKPTASKKLSANKIQDIKTLKEPTWNGKKLSLAELKGHIAFNNMINPISTKSMIEKFNAIPSNPIKFKTKKYLKKR